MCGAAARGNTLGDFGEWFTVMSSSPTAWTRTSLAQEEAFETVLKDLSSLDFHSLDWNITLNFVNSHHGPFLCHIYDVSPKRYHWRLSFTDKHPRHPTKNTQSTCSVLGVFLSSADDIYQYGTSFLDNHIHSIFSLVGLELDALTGHVFQTNGQERKRDFSACDTLSGLSSLH